MSSGSGTGSQGQFFGGGNMNDGNYQKKTPNPSNFKIVKCKNFEKGKDREIYLILEGACKYGTSCTFAHGDTELRTKSDNSMNMPMNNFNPMMGMQNPYMMDPSMMDPTMMIAMQQAMMSYGGMGKTEIINISRP